MDRSSVLSRDFWLGRDCCINIASFVLNPDALLTSSIAIGRVDRQGNGVMHAQVDIVNFTPTMLSQVTEFIVGQKMVYGTLIFGVSAPSDDIVAILQTRGTLIFGVSSPPDVIVVVLPTRSLKILFRGVGSS